MRHAPRKFDPALVWSTHLWEVTDLLRERYPWLTREQHDRRRRIALHEASHLVLAVEIARRTNDYNFGSRAFIRVPGASPKSGGKRGADGAVPIGNLYRHEDDMKVSAAGFLASVLLDEPDHAPAVITETPTPDQLDFRARQNKLLAGKVYSDDEARDAVYAVLDDTILALARNWPVIDWCATALLLHAGSTGDVPPKGWYGLLSYLSHEMPRESRRLNDRPLYVPFPRYAVDFAQTRAGSSH